MSNADLNVKVSDRTELTDKEHRAAYKLDVPDLSFEQLCSILITSDGRGNKIKKSALERIIVLVQENERRTN